MRQFKTGAEKVIVAIAVQLTAWPFVGLGAGAIIAIALLLGREIAQHEYKLAMQRHWEWGEIPPVKWYEGVTTGWSRDSLLDVGMPLVGVLFVWIGGALC